MLLNGFHETPNAILFTCLRSQAKCARWDDECELNLRLKVVGSDSLDHLIGPLDEMEQKAAFGLLTHIRTFMSSPPEANIHGSAGFQDTVFTHPLV